MPTLKLQWLPFIKSTIYSGSVPVLCIYYLTASCHSTEILTTEEATKTQEKQVVSPGPHKSQRTGPRFELKLDTHSNICKSYTQ